MKRIIRGLLVAVILAGAGATLTACGPCTDGQTRTRGFGQDVTHERCYKKVGDNAPHWYRDDMKPKTPKH